MAVMAERTTGQSTELTPVRHNTSVLKFTVEGKLQEVKWSSAYLIHKLIPS